MFKDLWAFIRERYPLQVTIPLVGVLSLAAVYPTFGSWKRLLLAVATVFLGLLALRAADDLVDMESDRQRCPDRGLPSGRIKAEAISRSIWFLWGLILFLNLVSLKALIFIVVLSLYYLFYFRGKSYLPHDIRPFFSTLIWGVIPLYVGLNLESLSLFHFLMMAFIWSAVVAHEIAHSLDNVQPNRWQALALRALFLFILSAFWGLAIWQVTGRPFFFGLFLLLTLAVILKLSLALLREPGPSRAKAFYIWGFIFFLLPLAGLIVDGFFRNGRG